MTKDIGSLVGLCAFSIVNLVYYSACSQVIALKRKYICIKMQSKETEKIQSHL